MPLALCGVLLLTAGLLFHKRFPATVPLSDFLRRRCCRARRERKINDNGTGAELCGCTRAPSVPPLFQARLARSLRRPPLMPNAHGGVAAGTSERLAACGSSRMRHRPRSPASISRAALEVRGPANRAADRVRLRRQTPCDTVDERRQKHKQ